MKIKNLVIPLIIIFTVLISSCGRKKEQAKTEKVPPKAVLNHRIEKVEAEEAVPNVVYYKVMLKDKTLSLYEVNGDMKKLVTSMEIKPEYYPQEDIDELKKGIEAYCKEDGYEILENFAN